jgi:hypothetical protein
MTESDNGRIRISEERELLGLDTEQFFIKLLVFKERIDKRLEESQQKNKKE